LGDNEELHAKALRRKGVFEKNDLESIAGVATIRFLPFSSRLRVRFCPTTMLKSRFWATLDFYVLPQALLGTRWQAILLPFVVIRAIVVIWR
jgi:hypothetical protein